MLFTPWICLAATQRPMPHSWIIQMKTTVPSPQKDSDFSTSFWLKNRPNKLLLISTGNIRNAELETLLMSNFDQLIAVLSENRFVELTREHMIVHI